MKANKLSLCFKVTIVVPGVHIFNQLCCFDKLGTLGVTDRRIKCFRFVCVTVFFFFLL